MTNDKIKISSQRIRFVRLRLSSRILSSYFNHLHKIFYTPKLTRTKIYICFFPNLSAGTSCVGCPCLCNFYNQIFWCSFCNCAPGFFFLLWSATKLTWTCCGATTIFRSMRAFLFAQPLGMLYENARCSVSLLWTVKTNNAIRCVIAVQASQFVSVMSGT